MGVFYWHNQQKCLLKYPIIRDIIRINLIISRHIGVIFQTFIKHILIIGGDVIGVVYLIDFENVHLSGLAGISCLEKKDSIIIFCREPDVTRIKKYLKKTDHKCKVSYFLVTASTKNAADFEIVSFIGVEHNSAEMFFIISRDHGFDVAIENYMRKKILCFRKENLENSMFKMGFENFGLEKTLHLL